MLNQAIFEPEQCQTGGQNTAIRLGFMPNIRAHGNLSGARDILRYSALQEKFHPLFLLMFNSSADHHYLSL